MTRYAVQCFVPTYDQAVVIVEADSLEEACEKGILKARTQGKWEGLDIYGTTFVEGIASNPSDDPYDDIHSRSLEVPSKYAEGAKGWDGT